MKHIEKFEKFNPINELTGAYMKRAAKSADEIGKTSTKLTHTIKNRQSNKFRKYTNPALQEYAKKLGFDIQKLEQEYNVYGVDRNKRDASFIILNNGEIENLKYELWDNGGLRKIQKLAQAIAKDSGKSKKL